MQIDYSQDFEKFDELDARIDACVLQLYFNSNSDIHEFIDQLPIPDFEKKRILGNISLAICYKNLNSK